MPGHCSRSTKSSIGSKCAGEAGRGTDKVNMGYLKEISIRSGERTEFIKLDAQVKNAIEESGVKDGV